MESSGGSDLPQARGEYSEFLCTIAENSNTDSPDERFLFENFLLASAISDKNINLVKYILEKYEIVRDCKDVDPLSVAARVGDVDIVKLLLEKGFGMRDARCRTNCESSRGGDMEFIRYPIDMVLITPELNENLLCNAASGGNIDAIKFFIDHGAAVNARDGMPLSMAALSSNLKAVELLVDRGADVNANENQAFVNAVLLGRIDIAEYLLRKGANINAQQNRPLRESAKCANLDLVRFLVQRGADVSEGGKRALKEAISGGFTDIAIYLLENGADMHADDDAPIILALKKRRLEIVKFFISKGVNVVNIVKGLDKNSYNVQKIDLWLDANHLRDVKGPDPQPRRLHPGADGSNEENQCVVTLQNIENGTKYRICSGIRAHVLSGDVVIYGKYAHRCPICTCLMVPTPYINE